MKDIVIVGAGGFGREVASFIEDINIIRNQWNIVGFVDDNKEVYKKQINGYKVLGNIDYLKSFNDIFYICAIANPEVREKIVCEINKYNIKAARIIHPSVILNNKYCEIGEGSIICPNCVVTVNTVIGKHNIVDYNSTIGHDVITKDYVTIYPGVNIAGNCRINKGVEIGAGAKIIQGLSIGKFTIIGAGAVVINDLKSGITVVGVPAINKLKNI